MAGIQAMRNQPELEGSFSRYHFSRMTMDSLADRFSSFPWQPGGYDHARRNVSN